MAQTLSIGTSATVHAPVTSSPLAGRPKALNLKRKAVSAPATPTHPVKASSSVLAFSIQDERPLPPPPPPKKRLGPSGIRDPGSIAMPPPMTPVKDRGGGRLSSSSNSMPNSPSRVGPSDAITYVVHSSVALVMLIVLL